MVATAHAAAVGPSSGSRPPARSRSARVDGVRGELHPAHGPGQDPPDVGVQHHVPPAVGEATRPRRPCSRRRPGSASRSAYRSGTSPPCRSTIAVGGRVQPQRPARVAQPAPGPHRLARWVRRPGRPGCGQRVQPALVDREHPATGVCCSMNSLTSTAHGGRRRLAPRQVAGVLVVPVEHAARAGRRRSVGTVRPRLAGRPRTAGSTGVAPGPRRPREVTVAP